MRPDELFSNCFSFREKSAIAGSTTSTCKRYLQSLQTAMLPNRLASSAIARNRFYCQDELTPRHNNKQCKAGVGRHSLTK